MEADQGLGSTSSSTISHKLPFLTSVRYWITLKLFQNLLPLLFRFRKSLPPAQQPTYLKTYSVYPAEPCRVFIPASYKAGQSKALPLFIDIHGGGFALGHAQVDDRDNAILSQKRGLCVVSIPYRKGPSYPFPAAPNDCADIIQAILDDPDLPVDKANVAVGGYSAGGNLSLAAVQLHGLHDRIKAVVAYYPATNLAKTLQEKLATSKIAPGRKSDMLAKLGPMFNWAYVSPGTDKQEPLLSPFFADRAKLPPKVCLFGCEYDILCQEAKELAEKLGESEKAEKKTSPDGNSWEKGGIRWEMIRGAEHGFNQTPEKDEEKLKVKRAKTEAMHQNAVEWLFREVYTA